MKALIPDTAPLIDPAPVLDRPHLTHLLVLGAGRRRPVRGVVHRHHQEPGALAHHLPRDRREAVLEADRRADGRQALDRQSCGPRSPGARSTGIWSIASIEREPRTERHVLAERARDGPCRSGPPPDRSRPEQDAGVLAPVRIVRARRRRSSAIPPSSPRPARRRRSPGRWRRPGSSAPSPHTTRSGGSPVSRSVLLDVELGDPNVLLRPPWQRAPRARPPGSPPRRAVRRRPRRTGSARGRPPPPRSRRGRRAIVADRRLPRQPAISALTSTTTKVTPHTPATEASRTVSAVVHLADPRGSPT